jgi:hypothetical protein
MHGLLIGLAVIAGLLVGAVIAVVVVTVYLSGAMRH